MKRFASVDFMRGLAIMLMLVLHMIMHTLNVDAMTADMSKVRLIEFVMMVILPFGGGMAGFFLMVSAMGNAVSMENELRNGASAKAIAGRQLTGGLILLFFAMLTEGLIGYHGDLGLFVHRSLMAASDPALGPVHWEWNHALFRFNHFETIHTIAWCIIINGLIHSALSAREKFRDKNKLILCYIKLAVLVLLLTPLAWAFAGLIIPGFPFSTGDFLSSYPRIGEATLGRFILVFFLEPLAGHPEPLFPYLAASFVGTIFGLFLTMPQEQRKTKSFVSATLRNGIIMYLIGLAGLLFNILWVIQKQGFDAGLNLYLNIWDHRGWTQEIFGTPFIGWYFQFMLLNGFGILVIMSMIRLVELRGKARPFGKRTRFVRRFGFVAFTNYSMQFLYFVAMFIAFDWLLGTPYARYTGFWGHAALTILVGIGLYAVLLYLWEKIRFAGTLEWAIREINYFLNRERRKKLKEKGIKWYNAGLLNVKGILYSADWADLVTESEIDHAGGEESRLAKKLAWAGLVFPPYSIVGFSIALRARKKESGHPENRKALIISSASLIFFLVWLTAFFILTPAMFG